MSILIYDESGSPTCSRSPRSRARRCTCSTISMAGKAYDAGAKVVQIRSHTYYLKTDVATKTYQLMHYDGADGDVPVVDNVVGLEVRYFGDPQPPVTIGKPLINTVGPWTWRSSPPATPRGFG